MIGESSTRSKNLERSDIDVSVVVPVYNPGDDFRFCVESLLGQSLPPERFELVFVDDGCTDGTDRVLDELAAHHENVVVVHEANSGWAGKPRNVGIDLARGRYIYFCDSDDTLGVEALERMVARADGVGAEILLGKMVGQGRNVPRELFRRDVERASLAQDPLLDSLTCHKLFKTAFLREHGLRFPEERRRLEDHVFVVRAYFAAETITVLANYPCYYHVLRGEGHISRSEVDWQDYYRRLREVIQIIEDNTEPGPLRDRLLARSFRVEMLGRLDRGGFLRRGVDERRRLFEEVRTLALEHYGPGVVDSLPLSLRVRSMLVRSGNLDGLVDQAHYEAGIRARTRLLALYWDGSAFGLAFEGSLERQGEPLTFGPGLDDLSLPVAASVAMQVGEVANDLGVELERGKADLVLRERATKVELYVPLHNHDQVRQSTLRGVTVTLRAEARLDPLSAAAAQLMSGGRWDAFVRIAMCGWTREARLGADRVEGLDEACVALPVGHPPRLLLPYWTKGDENLAVRVVGHRFVMALKKLTVQRVGARIVVDLPLRRALESPVPAELVRRGRWWTRTSPLDVELLERTHLRWTTRRSVRGRPGTSAALVLGSGASARIELPLPSVRSPSGVATDSATGAPDRC